MDGQKNQVKLYTEAEEKQLLISEKDRLSMEIQVPAWLPAPVQKGQVVGRVICYVNEEMIGLLPIYIAEDVDAVDLWWCVQKTFLHWLLK